MPADSEVVIRKATPQDIAASARICYDAFANINAAYNFPCDLSGPEHALGLITAIFNAQLATVLTAQDKGPKRCLEPPEGRQKLAQEKPR